MRGAIGCARFRPGAGAVLDQSHNEEWTCGTVSFLGQDPTDEGARSNNRCALHFFWQRSRRVTD